MRVSILLNVINRLAVTKICVRRALSSCGYSDFEILVCNNGSSDDGVKEFIHSLHPAFYIHNRKNMGNYQMLNQLMLRSTGDAFCIIGPDIMLPLNWLAILIERHESLLTPGVGGVYCVGEHPEIKMVPGKAGRVAIGAPKGAIFGTAFYSRDLVDAIGYYFEGYGVYGHGDSCFSLRAAAAGFQNWYLPLLASSHIGHDAAADDQYRQMKDDALRGGGEIYAERSSRFSTDWYVPAPQLLEENDYSHHYANL